ncbi:MAG TPA: F0F1 ATP synthase subunit A [Chloroflexota bacterium]|nr:F0F1 ATP synthase subunit A [Chloroflexota bacterium]
MAAHILAATLPIGEHWWVIGPSGSLWNIHMDTVIMSLLAAAILLLLGLYIRTHVTYAAPSRMQNAVEATMEFINGIIEDNLGRSPGTIASIALTLFFYIWVMNLIGLLPIPYFHSPTADVSTTFALALLVFVLMHIRYIQTSGLGAYRGHYWTRGFKAIVLNPVSVLLTVVTELSRPLTLSFRLFGNILAGEILLIVAGSLLPLEAAVVANVLINPLILAFGLFVGTVQAFIFTVLTVAYMAIASESAEAH